MFFFTVNLADRKSQLLVEQIDHLRQAHTIARKHYPFRALAFCVMPEHMHAIWRLPEDDAEFGLNTYESHEDELKRIAHN